MHGNVEEKQEKHDDCLAFGNHVAESLRNLSAEFKPRVKFEIQRVLCNYEEMQLRDRQVNQMQREPVDQDSLVQLDTYSGREYRIL